jgi:lipopolysaccharide transport system permease protein
MVVMAVTNKEKNIVLEIGKVDKEYWKDIWRFRELFYFLTWRDIKVRYKQTVIGLIWALIRPFLTMVVFTIIFSKVANMPSEGTAPYSIMVFAALLPWQLFSHSLTSSSNSVIGSANLISKIYFPRMIIPASSIITSLVDFAISFVMLIGMMIYYQFVPSLNVIYLPFFVLLAVMTAFGFGLIVSSLNVHYRDFKYIVPFAIQMGLYISPVGFSSSVVPEKWKLLYSLNPIVGVIDGFRWCILGENVTFYVPSLVTSLVISVVMMLIGIKTFRSMEKTFADAI